MTFVVRRPHTRTAVADAVLAVVAVLTLASCGFGGESGDTSGSGQAGGEPGSAAASGAGSASSANGTSSRQPDTQPAAGDLANFSCTQERGGVWAATGDVTNSAKEPMVYTVTVVTVDGSEISGEETKELRVKPDEALTFVLPTVARGSADACIPRLVRAPR